MISATIGNSGGHDPFFSLLQRRLRLRRPGGSMTFAMTDTSVGEIVRCRPRSRRTPTRLLTSASTAWAGSSGSTGSLQIRRENIVAIATT